MIGLEATFAAKLSSPDPKRALGEAGNDPKAIRRVAEEFEAVFLGEVIDQMFAGIPTDGEFGGGHAEGVYRSMLSQEYAKLIAAKGGIGVADAVEREILKMQEEAS